MTAKYLIVFACLASGISAHRQPAVPPPSDDYLPPLDVAPVVAPAAGSHTLHAPAQHGQPVVDAPVRPMHPRTQSHSHAVHPHPRNCQAIIRCPTGQKLSLYTDHKACWQFKNQCEAATANCMRRSKGLRVLVPARRRDCRGKIIHKPKPAIRPGHAHTHAHAPRPATGPN